MTSQSLKLLMRAGNPLIAMETPDEPRAMNMVREAVRDIGLPLAEWSVTEGLISASQTFVEAGKVIAALRHVKKTAYPEVYVFKDLGPHCKDPQVVRAIRDLYFSPDSRLWTMVMIDALPLPAEVHRMTVPFDIGLPDEQELRLGGSRYLSRGATPQPPPGRIADDQAGLGSVGTNAPRADQRGSLCVVAGAIHEDLVLDGADLPRIVEAKRRI